eukprot:Sro474_g150170.1 Putative amino-acid ABC transporter-binding protein YhdW (1044) ;mRNA; r:3799-7212
MSKTPPSPPSTSREHETPLSPFRPKRPTDDSFLEPENPNGIMMPSSSPPARTSLTRHVSDSHAASEAELQRASMIMRDFGGESKSCSAIHYNHHLSGRQLELLDVKEEAPSSSDQTEPTSEEEEDDDEARVCEKLQTAESKEEGGPEPTTDNATGATAGMCDALDARVSEKLQANSSSVESSIVEEPSAVQVADQLQVPAPSRMKTVPGSVAIAAGVQQTARVQASKSTCMGMSEEELMPQPFPQPTFEEEQAPGAYATPGRAPFTNSLVRLEQQQQDDLSPIPTTAQSHNNNNLDPVVVVNDSPLMAVCVDHDDLEHRIREEIIQASSRADVIHIEDSDGDYDEDLESKASSLDLELRQTRRKCTICATISTLIVMALIGVIVWSGVQTKDSSSSNSNSGDVEDEKKKDISSAAWMLQGILKRGTLRCGVVGDPSWNDQTVSSHDDGDKENEKGKDNNADKHGGRRHLRERSRQLQKSDKENSSGPKDVWGQRIPQDVAFEDLEVWEQDKLLDRAASNKEYDICRALGAAIFGKGGEAKVQMVYAWDWHETIFKDKMDLYIGTMSPTIDNDLFVPGRLIGYTFSAPYSYQGLRFGGNASDVRCAEALALGGTVSDDCDETIVCVHETSLELSDNSILPGLGDFPPNRTIILPRNEDLFVPLIDGTCNVIAGYATTVAESRAQKAGFDGDYVVGNGLVSKEPRVIETYDTTGGYSTFVNWVLLSLFAAAQHDITQGNAENFPKTSLFGDEYQDVFCNVIGAVGNINEIFSRDRTLSKEDVSPPSVQNTGLIMAHPIGRARRTGYDVLEKSKDGALRDLHARGKLRCAIRANRPGFAVEVSSGVTNKPFSGMDADFCRAVAAGFFASTDDTVIEFVVVDSEDEGYSMLSGGQVDIMAGATWAFREKAIEDKNSDGFEYSQPYFLFRGNSSTLEDNFCLAMKGGNYQWRSFVRWTIAATIFAEEEGIEQDRAEELPSIGSFGSAFEGMFRYSVSHVGNYREIYERNLGDRIPRSGPNLLNRNPQSSVLTLEAYVPPGLWHSFPFS